MCRGENSCQGQVLLKWRFVSLLTVNQEQFNFSLLRDNIQTERKIQKFTGIHKEMLNYPPEIKGKKCLQGTFFSAKGPRGDL